MNARWTGKFKTRRTWWGATRFVLEWRDPETGEEFWEDLDKDGLHCLEFQFTGHLRSIAQLADALADKEKPDGFDHDDYLEEFHQTLAKGVELLNQYFRRSKQ